ncbi:MAG: hypothetical protein AAF750_06540 [Planctomycetota bacterium]
MVNLPRPHAASVIDHQSTDTGVQLTYTEKPPQNPAVWLALGIFLAIWIIGLAIPLNRIITAAAPVTAATMIWFVAWGGVGVFFIINLVRQRIVGRVQRLMFDADHVVFIPKARVPQVNARPTTDAPHPRPRPRPPRPATLRPLRISDLDRTDLDSVEQGPNSGVDLQTPSGTIPLARTLTPADAQYLIDTFNTWRDG